MRPLSCPSFPRMLYCIGMKFKTFCCLELQLEGTPCLFGFRLGTSQLSSTAGLPYPSLSSGSSGGNSSEAANFSYFHLYSMLFSQLWEAAFPDFSWSSAENQTHLSLAKVLSSFLQQYCGNPKSSVLSDRLEGCLGRG